MSSSPLPELRWQLARDVDPATEGPAIDALRQGWDELEPGDTVELLKENRLRSVYRQELEPLGGPPGRSWVLKKFRHRGWASHLRHRVYPSHAEREFRALEKFHDWGFPVPRPLAFALRKRGGVPVEGALILEHVPETEVLASAFESCHEAPELLPPKRAQIRTWLVTSGRIVRAFHERGVRHPDLHGGNFLLRRDREGEPDRITLIDFHSCYFPGHLSPAARIRGIAMVGQSLRASLGDGEFRWFLLGYLHPEGHLRVADPEGRPASLPVDPLPLGTDPSRELADQIDSRLHDQILDREARVIRCIARLDARKVRSRTRRCLLEASVFHRERRGSRQTFQRRDFDLEGAGPLLTPEPPGELIQETARGWTAFARHPLTGQELFIKYRRHSPLRSWLARWFGHPLRHGWVGAHGLRTRGLPAPLGLALVEERRPGRIPAAWLLQERVPGRPLHDHLLRDPSEGPDPLEPARLRQLARSVGEALRRLHDARVESRDLSPQNLLVEELPDSSSPRLCWVDADDIRFPYRPGRRRRRRNLVQLANLPEGHVSTTTLLRALRAYDGDRRETWSRSEIADLRRDLLMEVLRTILRTSGAPAPSPPTAPSSGSSDAGS